MDWIFVNALRNSDDWRDCRVRPRMRYGNIFSVMHSQSMLALAPRKAENIGFMPYDRQCALSMRRGCFEILLWGLHGDCFGAPGKANSKVPGEPEQYQGRSAGPLTEAVGN
jgi:hypothetical protein